MTARVPLLLALCLCAACPSSGPATCATVRDCAQAERCVAGKCAASSTALGSIGDSCASGSECASGLGCSASSAGFPSGACTQDCGSGSCPGGSACADLRSSATAAQLCAPSCSSDSQCRQGYLCCQAQGNVCLPSALCVPPVLNVTCNAPTLVSKGTVVGHDTAPSGCVKPVQPSSLPGAQVLSKGTHTVGEKITFDVPAGTGSVTLVEQAVNASASVVYQGSVLENSVLADNITFPDGGVIFKDTGAPNDPSTVQVFYGGGSPSTGAQTLPNAAPLLSQVAAAGALPAGTWSFNVSDYAFECTASGSGCTDGGTAANTYDVKVLLKPGSGTSAGTLDMAFYIVTSTGLTSALAPSNPAVQRMVSTLASFYKQGGVCLGEVDFWDVPSWARSRYGTGIDADDTGPCSNLDQMLTLSQPGNKLDLFLVQSISATPQGGGTVVGIDGTIPGPATIGGTVHSGAAVSMANLTATGCGTNISLSSCGADNVAYIAAHEGGHYLGLFHTTELDGEYFDPLTDTGKCSCESCAPVSQQSSCATPTKTTPPAQPTIVEAPSCNAGACAGADDLMFWQLNDSVSKGRLTAQQGQVMRQNPAVK